MKSTTAVKDLVCGMEIETAAATGRTEYKGQTYYFCGAKCKEKFDLDPEQYVGRSAGTPKSGPGCCS
ncbi:MAG: YHS domain-containing protein [Nitrospiraceae bacterium]|jgi:Cu+-exporting ATPase|nr:YHS domain-containing protein [Nitrospiraceae bacterium]